MFLVGKIEVARYPRKLHGEIRSVRYHSQCKILSTYRLDYINTRSNVSQEKAIAISQLKSNAKEQQERKLEVDRDMNKKFEKMEQDIKKIDEKLDQFREDLEKTIQLISEKQPEEEGRAEELTKISEKVRDDIKKDMEIQYFKIPI